MVFETYRVGFIDLDFFYTKHQRLPEVKSLTEASSLVRGLG